MNMAVSLEKDSSDLLSNFVRKPFSCGKRTCTVRHSLKITCVGKKHHSASIRLRECYTIVHRRTSVQGTHAISGSFLSPTAGMIFLEYHQATFGQKVFLSVEFETDYKSKKGSLVLLLTFFLCFADLLST